VTTLGTTLVVKALSDRPVFAARYGVYSHRLGDLWLVRWRSNSGGAVLRQFFAETSSPSCRPRIDPAIASPLDYYPLPRPGERFPWPTPRSRRGSSAAGRRVAFLHGLLEGIARIEALGYQRLAGLGAPFPTRVLTTGGGAGNPAWTAIRARQLGVRSARSRTATRPTAQRCWRDRGRGALAELRRHHFSSFSTASASFADGVPGCSRCTRSRIGRASAPRPALASAAPTWKLISGCCGANHVGLLQQRQALLHPTGADQGPAIGVDHLGAAAAPARRPASPS